MTALEDELGVLLGSRDLADRLLKETTLRHLAEASVGELAALMPQRAAERLHAAFRVGRAAISPPRPKFLATAADAYRYLHPYLAGRETERMVVVGCDVRGRPLVTAIVGEGGPYGVSVRISDLFTPILRHRAVGMVMAHNHPSGEAVASPEDVALTVRALHAARILDINLIDHLIVAGRKFLSMRLEFADGFFDDEPMAGPTGP